MFAVSADACAPPALPNAGLAVVCTIPKAVIGELNELSTPIVIAVVSTKIDGIALLAVFCALVILSLHELLESAIALYAAIA